MNKKISYSILVIILALAVITGGVAAWFTFYSSAPTNAFTAGTVNISANETIIIPPEIITNWFPGDVVEKEFTITNTGSSDIYLRTHIVGAWGSLNPDSGKHSNTATVTATYNGVTYSSSDKAHYYVGAAPQDKASESKSGEAGLEEIKPEVIEPEVIEPEKSNTEESNLEESKPEEAEQEEPKTEEIN